jgi:hypothetical protein
LGDKDGPEITLNKDYASARGTMIIEGDKIAWPLNISDVECFQQAGYCYQSDVDIDDDTSGGPIYYLNSSVTPLPIASWNDEEVVATNEALCATTTLTINIKAKEVYWITRNNGQSCAMMAPLAKPQISELVNGFNVSQEYFAKKQEETNGYRSREYQQYLSDMRSAFDSDEKSRVALPSKAQASPATPQ